MKEKEASFRFLVPDGSLKEVTHKLLADAGLPISYPDGERSYQSVIGNSDLFLAPNNLATKMRPQDACWVVADGRADLAFAGEDLISESGQEAELIKLARYPLSRAGVGQVKLVVAVPKDSPIKSVLAIKPSHELVTEHPRIAKDWCDANSIRPKVRVSHGSLEAFSDVADAILETTETGRSLKVGGWRVIAEVMTAQCCLITHPAALAEPKKRKTIEAVKLLLDSVMAARTKRLVKCNVGKQKTLAAVLRLLPSADQPTINKLAGKNGFALESVVPAGQVPNLIIALKQLGATAVIDLPISRFVP